MPDPGSGADGAPAGDRERTGFPLPKRLLARKSAAKRQAEDLSVLPDAADEWISLLTADE